MTNINLLVTGGLGFIASNFIQKYHDTYNITVIDRMDICSSLKNIDNCNYHLIMTDIADKKLVLNTLNQNKITHIIHYAAQSHVDGSFANPMQYTMDNIVGTQTLLEACREYGKVCKFIHVSTDEVYGESHLDEDHKCETSILCPTNPYAASKAGAELIAMAYEKSFKLPIVITRGNNVYGERQYPEKLIPKFISLLREGKKCTIHGNGESIRSFIHVEDVADAFNIILEHGEIGEIYNIGSETEMSVLNVLKKLVENLFPSDNYRDHIEFTPDRPFNDKRYFISSTKLEKLGWKPRISFEEGLKRTIDWYKSIDIREHWTSLPDEFK